jgi:hypothetical protein
MIMKAKLKPVCVLMAFSALCSVGAIAAEDTSAKNENACIFSRSIRNWQVLDNRHIVIWASAKEAYLMTLITPIDDTGITMTLAFVDKDNDGMIRGRGSDSVAATGSSIHQIPSMISGMHRADETELQQLSEKYKTRLLPRKKDKNNSASSVSSSASSSVSMQPAQTGS